MFWMILAVCIIGIFLVFHTSHGRNKFHSTVANDDRLRGAETFNTATDTYIAISQNGFVAFKSPLSLKGIKIIHIKDINGFEIKKNGQSSANIGSAVVGGLLFGGIGAIIGGIGSSKEKIKDLSILFKINDFNNPTIEIKMMDYSTKSGSFVHKGIVSKVEKICNLLEIVEKKHKAIPEKPPEEDIKECPYCAETIKAKAKICRFCNKEIE